MTIEEAVKFAVHAKHMTDIQEVKEFYAIAEGALRNQIIICKHCDFSRDSDNRCMCDKSQWAGRTVKPDNYCGCFLPRNEPMTLDELKQLPLKEWVWVEVLQKRSGSGSESAYYRKCLGWKPENTFFCGYPGWATAFDYADYGMTWIAYWNKP